MSAEDFEFGKDCFGLDQCQARLYAAVARHAVLVMAALAICAVTAALLKDRTDTQAPPPVSADQLPPAEPGMIPLTIPEIKRLPAFLAARPLAARQGPQAPTAPEPGELPIGRAGPGREGSRPRGAAVGQAAGPLSNQGQGCGVHMV